MEKKTRRKQKKDRLRCFVVSAELEGSIPAPGINSLSRDRCTCLLIRPTLPGPLHHHASHPLPLGRHRRPSWARRRLRRSSSSPDPEPSLRHPSWVGHIPGCCFHHSPSQPPPPLAALQLFALATRGRGSGAVWQVWEQEEVQEGRKMCGRKLGLQV